MVIEWWLMRVMIVKIINWHVINVVKLKETWVSRSWQNEFRSCNVVLRVLFLILRSSNVATCDVPRTRTTLRDRSFTAAGPRLWNNLPLHLRDFELLLLKFRRLLKTHLFGWRSRHLVTYFRYSVLTNVLTYLLILLSHVRQVVVCIHAGRLVIKRLCVWLTAVTLHKTVLGKLFTHTHTCFAVSYTHLTLPTIYSV